MYQGTCVNVCPPGFYASNGACLTCPMNCQTCNSTSPCSACNSPYVLFNSQCYDACPISTYQLANRTCTDCSSNCLRCNGSSACLECKSNYSLYNNSCVTTCPQGTYQSTLTGSVVVQCINCTVNCLVCDGSGCLQCVNPYILYNKECSNTTCPSGTYLEGTNCLNCSDKCNSCVNSTWCNQCISPYLTY